ncbi:MAG: Abi family protein [Clostridia bacterium]|nr:Abi family protein [Clostridia bacterium]
MTKKKTQKVYFNSDQQIEKLKRDGLHIPDEKHAKRRLKWEGYYNFAVGYNRLFKDQNKRYRKGVSFAHVEALFDFDKRLREIVYEATQQVECNIKAMLSDVFSARYGVDEKLYLREENFTQAPTELPHVRWIIGTCRSALQDACKTGSSAYRDYIAYYDKTYRHVPFWVLIRLLSFGNASKFLSLLKTDDGREIAREYGVAYPDLCNMIELLVCFRNIAAHGERVYCAHLPRVRLTQTLGVLTKLQLPKRQDGTALYGNNDCMAMLVALKYVLPKKAFDEYFAQLKRAVETLESQLPAFAYHRVLHEMGLQGSWKKLDLM